MSNPTKKPKAGMPAHAGRRVLKAWAVCKRSGNRNYIKYVRLWGRHDHEKFPPTDLGYKGLIAIPATLSFALPSKGSAKKKRG